MPKSPINKAEIENLFSENGASAIIIWHPLQPGQFKEKVADVIEEIDYNPEMLDEYIEQKCLYSDILSQMD